MGSGGPELHGRDDHEHDEAAHDPELADAIWRLDNVELTTVGIDIGSATSHLMFSRLVLHRRSEDYSNRFVVVRREVLYRSAVMLTPYRPDGPIDLDALHRFVEAAYLESGLAREDVDAGAVILTGVALERANARAIAELFAAEGGKFVCASAGHNLEALLAAFGSGAAAMSRDRGEVLNVDVGGGTTKLALAREGAVVATMTVAAGSRLVEMDERGRIRRIEPEAAALAERSGVALVLGAVLAPEDRKRLAAALADRVVGAIRGRPEAVLAGGLPAAMRPRAVTFSGGVSELLDGERRDFGDLGAELAAALRDRYGELPAPVVRSAERIRATAIGASQFTVQASGNTIHVSDSSLLPLHNVPVVSVETPGPEPDGAAVRERIERGAERLDLGHSDGPLAIALRWSGEPAYRTLRALADAIAGAHRAAPRRDTPVIVALDSDVGASIGRILADELGIATGVIAIDGLELSELDYIDIGERILPANVVPVVVKSLLFPDAEHVRVPQILSETRS